MYVCMYACMYAPNHRYSVSWRLPGGERERGGEGRGGFAHTVPRRDGWVGGWRAMDIFTSIWYVDAFVRSFVRSFLVSESRTVPIRPRPRPRVQRQMITSPLGRRLPSLFPSILPFFYSSCVRGGEEKGRGGEGGSWLLALDKYINRFYATNLTHCMRRARLREHTQHMHRATHYASRLVSSRLVSSRLVSASCSRVLPSIELAKKGGSSSPLPFPSFCCLCCCPPPLCRFIPRAHLFA